MTRARLIGSVFATLAAALLMACGPKRISGPSRPGEDLIVLLPDPESGSTGRARVSTPSGSVDLIAERNATRVVANQPPGAVTTLSAGEANRLFDDVLSALPPEARHFSLYFRFDSNVLTDEARALMLEILETVKKRPAPDVVVIGHTDTAGSKAENVALGLKRATTVRNLLVQGGLATSAVEVTSHGEADLLIPTADGTLEPRNRRVEITVR